VHARPDDSYAADAFEGLAKAQRSMQERALARFNALEVSVPFTLCLWTQTLNNTLLSIDTFMFGFQTLIKRYITRIISIQTQST
jgi:hypothetical protein